MKFVLGLATTAAMAVTPTAAFTANLSRASRRDSRLAARVDSSDLVKEAMKLSKKYGSNSAQARLAWEAVEEVDASDNSVASLGSLNEECEVETEVIPQECLEYGEALEELQDLISSTKPLAANSKNVEPVKLSAPSGVAGEASPELQAALKEARIITSKKGLASPQAKVAWETVEEIAASGNSNAIGAVLDQNECFVEEAAQEACAALEELNKIIGTPIADKLAAMLSTEEGTAEMRALWEDLDKDGNGKVSGKEWGSKVYAKKDIMSKYFGGSTLREIGEAFNRIDSNGDDSLTWDEFRSEIKSYKAAKQTNVADKLAAMLSTEEGTAAMRTLWEDLDKDGDGKISGKEWGSKVYAKKDIMSKYFGGSTLQEIGEAFNRIDSNGDDSLTWDEFRSEIKSYKAVQQMKEALAKKEGKAKLKKLWDTLDKNGDGKITGKEWGSKVYAKKDIMSKFFGGTDMASIGKGFNRIDKNGDDLLTWEEFESSVNSY